MKLVYLIILSLSIMLFSCDKHSCFELYGKWRIIEYKCIATSCPIGLSQVADGGDYSLEFGNQGIITCNTGCNSGSSRYTVNGSKLTFSETTFTEKACEDILMEESVKHILPVIKAFEIKNDSVLFLKDADSHILMKLTK